ncbi:E3 ubiquitin-protein ligase CIP8-like [Mangifera indica]|uniref:E3 ubiquitin-protein ligase CIP8-like n=1 Tax=Mangifera indica TaxID=29780 RepID=UPI001CFBCB2D|nr:E3 ubiquitin-protein ligase CIP8-like [Mangifera indica]
MAESPSQTASPTASSDTETTHYWCYHCEKRVSIETLANLPDIICQECRNGFVESIPAPTFSSPPTLTPDHVDDPSFGSQFLQVLRLIAQAARDDDVPQQQSQDPHSEDDFLRIELDEWENNDEDDDANENEDNQNDDEEEDNEDDEENGTGNDQSDNENQGNREIDDEEDPSLTRREEIRLRIRDLATRARTGPNRILDWADILMGLEDNSIEFRLEVPESDRYIGNPEDYVDAAGYEALLQNLAENDGGRRGAPPAAKSAVLELPTVEILSEQEAIVCAICKDMVNVGETATKLPCAHLYHGNCILPWLGSRNSCPVCRFELPTDDPEYEEERNKRIDGGGASVSSEETTSSG